MAFLFLYIVCMSLNTDIIFLYSIFLHHTFYRKIQVMYNNGVHFIFHFISLQVIDNFTIMWYIVIEDKRLDTVGELDPGTIRNTCLFIMLSSHKINLSEKLSRIQSAYFVRNFFIFKKFNLIQYWSISNISEVCHSILNFSWHFW